MARSLNRATSLYLDFWRLLAALTVFVGHVSGQRLTGGLFWQVAPHMDEAVALFFVLSGYVIGYATDRAEGTARAYAVSRLARVYSVALPALVLTFILDAVGTLCRPDLYSASWGYHTQGQFWQFASGLLFLNQIWGLRVPQGSDLPYWSLGYEVWYYVIFGLAMFAPGRWKGASVLLAVVFVGPAIAAMLPLWLLGLWGYKFSASHPLGRRAGGLLCAGSLLAWLAYEIWLRGALTAAWPIPAFLKRPSLLEDYVVGGFFIAHIMGFQAVAGWFEPLAARLLRPLRWAAGATFTIYLFHLPVAQFLTTQVPWPPAAWPTRLVILGGTLLILLVLAELTERRKDPWKRGFNALLAQVRRGQPVA